MACFLFLLHSLRLHLCHVGGDERAPVPSLQIELREAQTLHQLQENPGGGEAVEPWSGSGDTFVNIFRQIYLELVDVFYLVYERLLRNRSQG